MNIIQEEIEKIRHTYYGTDMDFDWNKHSVDDELTVYYKDNVDPNLVKDFLISFNNARKKIENNFKLKLGREYKDPDASYNIWFGKNIVFDNDKKFKRSAEYVRTEAEHAPEKSFYFNLPVFDETLDFSKQEWIPNPTNKRQRAFNANKIEDLITHEIAHALYFLQPMEYRKRWQKYYDDGGWENATSLYGQESSTEMFAETIVDIINNEEHQITKDLKNIFHFTF
jgi:hypothetical protein